MSKTKQARPDAVAGQVERSVRPAAVVCDKHVSGGAVVRWAGSSIPCPPETQLYTQAALDAAVAAARDACASAAWIHYMDVCKARALAPAAGCLVCGMGPHAPAQAEGIPPALAQDAQRRGEAVTTAREPMDAPDPTKTPSATAVGTRLDRPVGRL